MQAVYEPGDPFHQPWWGGLFFYYVSMMLWQDFIFEKKSCIRYLLVDDEAPTVWSGVLGDAPTWTAPRQPVGRVSRSSSTAASS